MRHWQQFPPDYRQQELQQIAGWLAAGESGSVIGLPGVGRSSFFDFLANRPDRLAAHLPAGQPAILLIPLDLNILPDFQMATFYRAILRSFFESQARMESPLADLISTLFRKCEGSQDAFLAQSALREFLLACEAGGYRVALLLNRFDDFCAIASQEVTRTLLSVRDSFRDTLLFIAGVRRDLRYGTGLDQADPLFQLLDTHSCWLKPLTALAAQQMLARRLDHLRDEDVAHVISLLPALTGHWPSLLRVAGQLYAQRLLPADIELWGEMIAAHQATQYRLTRLWRSLTAAEARLLQKVAQADTVSRAGLPPVEQEICLRLQQLGVFVEGERGLELSSPLLSSYAAGLGELSAGLFWLDEASGELMQDQEPLHHLTAQQQALLRLFLRSAQQRLSYTQIIEEVWPKESAGKEGVEIATLHQAIHSLRLKIEPEPRRPRYVINYTDWPEGGYIFYAEGRPVDVTSSRSSS
ncbi:MAG: winged helix-turn-helix domain-containing protein [Anaerolineales bacterium]|nr:winged helix-turn-helix domain-containing protein [Anaerolineales bacterium]